MDFDLSEEQRIFQKAIRDFAEREIAPLVEKAEEEERLPLELFPRMGRLGYLGIRYPEAYGGSGADKISECIWAEELFRICRGIATSLFAHSHLGTFPLFAFGTEEQKARFLLPAIRGEKIAAFALTEPNAGSDVQAIESRARKEGDGYVLRGSKMFVTNGTLADFILAAAYTDRSRGFDGISLFIVERGTEGFRVSRKLRKEGSRSSETAELSFEDCPISAKNLVGEREGAFRDILKTLVEGRVVIAAGATGVARAAFEAALQYSKERVAFGRPIGQFQAIGFKLADMATWIEIARTMIYRVAWMVDQKKKCTAEASMAKLFATEMAEKVTNEAMQIFGGYSQMREFPVGRYWRDARQLKIGEGTSEIQRRIICHQLGLKTD
ncbi:MAG: acyl-CoA dehydrogenase family protein [Thermodesulfobacteriota bacterium]|nr:acyl-CoA dehydrogenase family protein [Thermodesulfobacteriota bacterium]